MSAADEREGEAEPAPEREPEAPEALEAFEAPRYSDSNLPKPGDVIAERYRIDSELGRGGMAVVYAATQLTSGQPTGPHGSSRGDGRRVALKWMFEGRSHRDERRRRFLREARAAGSIQHPNVVRVFDAGEHDKGVFLVMELVEGESLSSVLARGPMSATQATDLLMPALRGIDAAHRKGIVHRDLKPDNLYVCTPNKKGAREIKVLDFGLSKLIGPAVDSLLTLPGMLVGTPQYMSPEQADHRIGNADERSDIYTLAVILYEAVAGRRPFESESFAGLLMKVAHEDPTPLDEIASDLPDDFAAVVMWALSRDPILRPVSVEDFGVALESFGSVPFAAQGRASEARVSAIRESMRVPAARASERAPAKLSERAPAPRASERAPAMAATSAQRATAPASARSSSSSTKLVIAAVVLLFSIAALWVFGDDRARDTDRSSNLVPVGPSAAVAPVAPTAERATQAPSTTQPAPSTPQAPQAIAPTAPSVPITGALEGDKPAAPAAQGSPSARRARANQAAAAVASTQATPSTAAPVTPAPEAPPTGSAPSGASDRKVNGKPIGVADPWE